MLKRDPGQLVAQAYGCLSEHGKLSNTEKAETKEERDCRQNSRKQGACNTGVLQAGRAQQQMNEKMNAQMSRGDNQEINKPHHERKE